MANTARFHFKLASAPASMPAQYQLLNFRKYGYGMWYYGDTDGHLYHGETEFINSDFWISESKYGLPLWFTSYLFPGVQANMYTDKAPAPDTTDVIIQGIAVNILTGVGLAALKALF